MIPLIILAIESPDDRDFMINLYCKYNRLMYSTVIKIVADEWDTDDIMQSAIEKLIDKIPTLKTLGDPQLTNYIVKTCENTSYSHLRKQKRIVYLDDEDLDEYDGEISDPELWLLTKERLDCTNKAWGFLDQKTKQILTWKYMLHLSDAEIAEELGIQSSSVRMTLTRARQKFKNKIEELEN